MERRNDHSLRTAVEQIRGQIHSASEATQVYRQALCEALAITCSPFGFVLQRQSQPDHTGYQVPICLNTSVPPPSGAAAPATRYTDVAIAPGDANTLGIALNTVFIQQSAQQYDQQALSTLPLPPHWPVLKDLLVIPIGDGRQAFAALCLANGEPDYDLTLLKRLQPLVSSCSYVLRTITRHQSTHARLKQVAPVAHGEGGNRIAEPGLSEVASHQQTNPWPNPLDLQASLDRLESFCMEGVIEIDESLNITRFNPAAEKMFGIPAHRAFGQPISQLLPERFPGEHRIHLFGDSGDIQPRNKQENFLARRDKDTLFPVDIVSFTHFKQQRRHHMVLLQDKSELFHTQRVHAQQTQRFKAVADMAPIGILQTNARWEGIYVNDRWCTICEMSQAESLGLGWINAMHREDVEQTLEHLRSAMLEGQEFNTECRLQTPLGGIVWAELRVRPLLENHRERSGFLATLADVTYQHRAEEKLRHMAERDTLTGLANRALFQQRLEHGLSRVARHGALVLFSLDLDGFKVINDTLGHSAGDALLVDVARRLEQCLRTEDTVARMGGDEFSVLMEGVSNSLMAADIAEKMLHALENPFHIEQQEVFVSASIGISFATSAHRSDPQSLLKQADIALYRAKTAGRNNYQYFSPEMAQESKERLYLGNSLHHALGRREFEVFYQLQADTGDQGITGSEALLRWRHPERGLLTPDQFIPLLEETGLIVPVGRWLFWRAFSDHKCWQDQGLMSPKSHISVNLSPRQLHDNSFLEGVSDALTETKLSPQNVVVEITESVLLDESTDVNDILCQLHHQGIKIALDDFGTGYSSLSYLKRFPIDYLKIDRSFIRDILSDPEDAAITQAVIALARSLNLTVIAEGVEDAETLQRLGDWECDAYQGYHLNRPCPVTDAGVLLAEAMGDNIVALSPTP